MWTTGRLARQQCSSYYVRWKPGGQKLPSSQTIDFSRNPILLLHASTNKCTHQNTTHHEYSTRTRFDTKVPFSGSFRKKTYKEYSKIIINTESKVLGLYSFFLNSLRMAPRWRNMQEFNNCYELYSNKCTCGLKY